MSIQFKFRFPISDGEVEVENVDGQLRITIPGAPDRTVNRVYVERVDDGYLVRTHNQEMNAVIDDNDELHEGE